MRTTKQGSASMTQALDAAARTVQAVGPDRIELVTVTRDRVCLQPVLLGEGEEIAQVLGRDSAPMSHTNPGPTIAPLLIALDIDGTLADHGAATVLQNLLADPAPCTVEQTMAGTAE